MWKKLTSHPLVARVSFTGGPKSAQNIINNSANNFAEVSLELGGKSPFIVFDDANIESAVNGSIAGIFGQESCVAGLYLHEKIADEFLHKMMNVVNSIKLGDPLEEDTQMGPLCTLNQIESIEREIAFARSEGAEILCGGKRPSKFFFNPTIISCPKQALRIVDTELLGRFLVFLPLEMNKK